ncbi:hypothetical protein C8R45DRAFT_937239 [Mycena sanguinolenta]|nr:hypothetical protein C8R45DRAFT_937239 [Mycena sanguinolenta]
MLRQLANGSRKDWAVPSSDRDSTQLVHGRRAAAYPDTKSLVRKRRRQGAVTLYLTTGGLSRESITIFPDFPGSSLLLLQTRPLALNTNERDEKEIKGTFRITRRLSCQRRAPNRNTCISGPGPRRRYTAWFLSMVSYGVLVGLAPPIATGQQCSLLSLSTSAGTPGSRILTACWRHPVACGCQAYNISAIKFRDCGSPNPSAAGAPMRADPRWWLAAASATTTLCSTRRPVVGEIFAYEQRYHNVSLSPAAG